MTFLIGFLLTVHIATCILLVLIVMMQRPRSEGLGTAFGGGVTDNLFGASTGNVLVKITTWLGIIFFCTTILLAYIYSHRSSTGSSTLLDQLKAIPEATASTNRAPSDIVVTNSSTATPVPVTVPPSSIPTESKSASTKSAIPVEKPPPAPTPKP